MFHPLNGCRMKKLVCLLGIFLFGSASFPMAMELDRSKEDQKNLGQKRTWSQTKDPTDELIIPPRFDKKFSMSMKNLEIIYGKSLAILGGLKKIIISSTLFSMFDHKISETIISFLIPLNDAIRVPLLKIEPTQESINTIYDILIHANKLKMAPSLAAEVLLPDLNNSYRGLKNLRYVNKAFYARLQCVVLKLKYFKMAYKSRNELEKYFLSSYRNINNGKISFSYQTKVDSTIIPIDLLSTPLYQKSLKSLTLEKLIIHIPSQISLFGDLRSIVLVGNKSLAPEMAQLKNLERIELINWSHIPKEFLGYPLKELILKAEGGITQSMTEIPSYIKELGTLKKLCLNIPPLEKLPQSLYDMENLEEIELHPYHHLDGQSLILLEKIKKKKKEKGKTFAIKNFSSRYTQGKLKEYKSTIQGKRQPPKKNQKI